MSDAPQNSTRKPWRLGPAVFIATGTWLGLFPYAPGTIGCLWGLPLAWGLGHLPWWGQLVGIVLLFFLGVPLCTAAVKRLGGKKDPGSIVFDEIASLPITFFLVSMDGPLVLLAGFALHRLFDITKPPPARQLESLPDGLGIMADDVIAGIYSNLALQAILHFMSSD